VKDGNRRPAGSAGKSPQALWVLAAISRAGSLKRQGRVPKKCCGRGAPLDRPAIGRAGGGKADLNKAHDPIAGVRHYCDNGPKGTAKIGRWRVPERALRRINMTVKVLFPTSFFPI